MADTISIDMANVLHYLRDSKTKCVEALNAEIYPVEAAPYLRGQRDAYDDCLNKVTQVLQSHAKSWVKFATYLEQELGE